MNEAQAKKTPVTLWHLWKFGWWLADLIGVNTAHVTVLRDLLDEALDVHPFNRRSAKDHDA